MTSMMLVGLLPNSRDPFSPSVQLSNHHGHHKHMELMPLSSQVRKAARVRLGTVYGSQRIDLEFGASWLGVWLGNMELE